MAGKVRWSDYDQFEDILNRYLPEDGQGDTRAEQAVTAINKLVYAFYNNGAVIADALSEYDPNLRSYAAWLRKHTSSRAVLLLVKLEDAEDTDSYAKYLYELTDYLLDEPKLRTLSKYDTVGDIYED